LRKNIRTLVLGVIIFSSLMFITAPSVKNARANIDPLNIGDEFYYKVDSKTTSEYEYIFLPDDNREYDAYISNNRYTYYTNGAFALKIENLYSSSVEAKTVRSAMVREKQDWNNIYYKWDTSGWILDYNYSDTYYYYDEYESYGSVYTNNYNNYSKLQLDPFYYFYSSTYIETQTLSYVVNGESFDLAIDIYFYNDSGADGTGYTSWSLYESYGVEYNVTSTSYYEYYYYVDNNTGTLMQYNSNYVYYASGSFYEWVDYDDYNTNVSYTYKYHMYEETKYMLTKATEFYSTSNSYAFLPYLEFTDYSWQQPITNSTTEIVFPLIFSDDTVRLEVYYRDPEYYYYSLFDNITISSTSYNYTVYVDQLNYYWGYSQSFRFKAFDNAGNVFMSSVYIADDRIILPDWKSQVKFPDIGKGIEYDSLYIGEIYVYSDTSWTLSVEFYYNQSDLTQYYSNWYEGFGNTTLNVYAGYNYPIGDYTANLTFIDAVNTTYTALIPVKIYPEGTDIWSPSLDTMWYPDKYSGEPYKYALGTYETFYFNVYDENPGYYEFYINSVLYDSGNYSDDWNYYYYPFADLFNTTGLYNLTVVAYDSWGNYRIETCWVQVYPEGTDVKDPYVGTSFYSYFHLGSSNRYTFWLYEDFPAYYELKVDDTILYSGEYTNGEEIYFYGSDIFTDTGDYTVSIFLNDTSGNEYSDSWIIHVLEAAYEGNPPEFSYVYDVDQYIIGDEYWVSFNINDDYPDVYNLYVDGNLTLENATYRGSGWYDDTQWLNLQDFIFTEGMHTITIEAFDQWGNSANISFTVNAYSSPPDYSDPFISSDYSNGDVIKYKLGTYFELRFVLFDDNPANYTFYINYEVVDSGTYYDGMELVYALGDYITEEGTYTITIEATDTSSNIQSITFKVEAYSSSTGDGSNTEPTESTRQTLELSFNYWPLFISLPVMTILLKKRKR